MKLTRLLLNRMSISLTIILGLWAVLFYIYLNRHIYRLADMGLRSYATEQITSYLTHPENFPLLKDLNETGQYSHSIIPLSNLGPAPGEKLVDGKVPIYTSGEKAFRKTRSYYTVFRNAHDEALLFRAWTDVEDEEKLLHNALGWIIVIFIGVLITVLCVSYLVIERNMQPLYMMVERLKGYRLGDSFHKVENPGKVKEFQILNHTVDQLFQRSSHLYQQQKELVDNAAHELQTPLAVSMNHLEQMMQHPGLDQEMMKEIVQVHNTLRKLSRLQKDLLRLSRIENGAYTDVQPIDLQNLIEDSVNDLKDIFSHKQLDCHIQINHPYQWIMNPSLSQLLVHNLIRNAFIHTSPGRKIEINLDGQEFQVANPGENPLDKEIIFRRFSRTSHKEGSSGLGLSIAQAICQQSNLELDYQFDLVARMHIFTVKEK